MRVILYDGEPWQLELIRERAKYLSGKYLRTELHYRIVFL